MMTTSDSSRLSRRSLLRSMTALAGGAALSHQAMGSAQAAMSDLPKGFGKGRTVAVIGGGMAGLTAGWKLANAGFKVTIYEADSRYGGRSLTVRPDEAGNNGTPYKKWWFDKYNPERLFPAMYVSRYKEDSRSPDPVEQVCHFKDVTWKPGNGSPVELFLNAGPGRIPSDHTELLKLCGKIGVALEPYIFQSNYNLLRSKKFNNGTPVAYNQINYSLKGEIAATLAKFTEASCAAGQGNNDLMGAMLKEFGDLDAKCDYKGSVRLGYSELPGGWNTPGTVKAKVPLDKVLESGFVAGGDPELTPGSFLFNADNILWQNSLMQPVGGMDRIWQRLLVQEIPLDSVNPRASDPRLPGLQRRDEQRRSRGQNPIRYVGDLVLLNHRATGIRQIPGGDKIYIETNGSHTEKADFCISTMAPNLLARILQGVSEGFLPALAKVQQVPAIKVGWQAKSRFWESEDHIYGGISWTDDDIGQIWYPSEDFNAPTGVLTGAYNRGPTALTFSQLSQTARIDNALNGGQNLHPCFADKVYADKGVTIAWHFMPFQVGGWSALTAKLDPETYNTIIKPQGRLYLAGDAYSYLPGWLEGAVTSVQKAIGALPPA